MSSSTKEIVDFPPLTLKPKRPVNLLLLLAKIEEDYSDDKAILTNIESLKKVLYLNSLKLELNLYLKSKY